MGFTISGATLTGGIVLTPPGGSPSPSGGSPFQGSNFGYTSGGYLPNDTLTNVIDKFPFASDANASDVGDLSQIIYSLTGQSSTDNGYASGGSNWPASNTIDKFPFASDGNATDVGDLSVARYGPAGQSSSASGYTSGGELGAPTYQKSSNIDKFSFSSDGNATDVGDLTLARTYASGHSSSANGYTSSGQGAPGPTYVPSNFTIDKFPFASDANATDVGDLTVETFGRMGQNSTDNGYSSGGGYVTDIDKFPFASDGNATDIGDLTVARRYGASQSSTASGYASGGAGPSVPYYNTIDKFPFASDANATDVGNLTQSKQGVAGQQY